MIKTKLISNPADPKMENAGNFIEDFAICENTGAVRRKMN
jgi:hypothetical protein